MIKNKIALVTGANRGLGFETVRQLANLGIEVILTSRSVEKGRNAIKDLEKEGIKAHFMQLDVTSEESIKKALEKVTNEFGRLDILVNNAGIYIDKGKSILDVNIEAFHKTIETNLYGSLLVSKAFIPLMKKNNYGRIVNVSSDLGRLSGMAGSGSSPAYKISKTALNALTRLLAGAVRGQNILVNSACPGWTKTEMGGPMAPKTVEQGADTIVWLATLPDNGPTGGFFQNRQQLDW